MKCNICPRGCNTDRNKAAGFCRSGEMFRVARAAPHFWEEPYISGTRGSGTVFFAGCNLRCVYCQNYEISSGCEGRDVTDDELKGIFTRLIEKGVHNLNLVTPTHYALRLAKVLREFNSPVPVVWNTSGYEKTETLRELEGLVDIYLTDIKYYDSAVAEKYSLAPDYPETAFAALAEMLRQTGSLELDGDSIAKRGVIVRHLVLPGNVSQAYKIFDCLARDFGTDICVSLMRQYVPCAGAKDIPPLDRELSGREYMLAKKRVLSLGFENCCFQGRASATQDFIPDFNLEGVDN